MLRNWCEPTKSMTWVMGLVLAPGGLAQCGTATEVVESTGMVFADTDPTSSPDLASVSSTANSGSWYLFNRVGEGVKRGSPTVCSAQCCYY